MQRYFAEPPALPGGSFFIKGEDARHIARVMRMGVGDACVVVSGGIAHTAEIVRISAESVELRPVCALEESPELPIEAVIACGLPKGDKLEWIAQKGTELGMSALLPFASERSIVKWDAQKSKKKGERLQKIAKEAAEQSHRLRIPTVLPLSDISSLAASASDFDMCLLADEEEAKAARPLSLKEALTSAQTPRTLLIAFGPEGGFAREEVELLQAAGFRSVALGPRILRAETAPLYALAALSYEME